MENFTVYNPTTLHFGKNVVENELYNTLKLYGNSVYLIYGKGSVVKYGYYDLIYKTLKKADIKIIEYSGIKPNPTLEDVENAVKKGIDEKPDVILALGGGSVIDSAKLIAFCILDETDPWDVMTGKTIPASSLPLISILTLAATGTEMNPFAVIQNNKTNEKLGFGHPLMYPKHSFLDPQLSYSVPLNYTSYGIADIIAHAFENYFGKGESPLADRFVASVVKECMNFAPLVLKEPDNYEYRANIMLQSTCALNGITSYGKKGGDWGVHSIGHTLSMLYDTPHGASLSIAYPAWLNLVKDRISDKIKNLSNLVFNTNDIDSFIQNLKGFFKSIDCPIYLEDIGITRNNKIEILDLMRKNKISGSNIFMSTDDHETVLDLMYSDK